MMFPTRLIDYHRWLRRIATIRSIGARLRCGVDAIALAWCRPLVPASGRRERNTQLAAIHAADPPELIAARTVLSAIIAGVAAGVFTFVTILHLRAEPAVVTQLTSRIGIDTLTLSPAPAAVFAAGCSTLVAVAVTAATYRFRWVLIDRRVTARERRIDRTLPRAVACMYALARSGMPLPAVLRTVAAHRNVYGDTAVAIGVTVREIDQFGADVITALASTSDRTPSTEFAEFASDLAAAVDSGQPIDDYLQQQHERYREAAVDSQQGFLDRLSTAAEGYVTGLVVGPLFVVTTLTVVGLVVTDTLPVLRVVVFGLLPIGTGGVLLGLDRLLASHRFPVATHSDGQPSYRSVAPPGDHATIQPTASSRDWSSQRSMLRIADRLSRCRRWLRRPIATLAANPWVTLLVTVPLGVGWIRLAIEPSRLSMATLSPATRPLSIALVGICSSYAVAYEVGAARRRRLAAAVPVFLDRLASVNEAGLSVVDGLDRVADGDLGALSAPLARVRRDVRWGADVTNAFRRLASRVRSPPVTGAVALVTNALRASNRIGPVAAIAAAELRASQRLAARRRRAMATYLVVIYVAFLVFLGIIAALSASFFPAVEAAATGPIGGLSTTGVPRTGMARVGGVTPAVGAYETLLMQVTMIQAICSGLVAGRLGEGALRAGIKHVAVLLAISQVAWWFI
ncbi:secretion system protein [Halonotius aquaticus]|uniref:Secretion system protein n=1 Tax=Halonotius aquaticus TaxID=2216978 RepID=A0A3A6Q9Z3_9EURY|nr:type II secretion system F family protein [Halonotius aquaticus]RJX42687.1 secretion system protein [Halonotius aquaticus]